MSAVSLTLKARRFVEIPDVESATDGETTGLVGAPLFLLRVEFMQFPDLFLAGCGSNLNRSPAGLLV